MTAEEEKLVLENKGLVYAMSHKYYIKLQNTVELEDLQSVAFIGLVKSAQTYDKDSGYAFSTYAYKVIQNEFNIYIKDSMKHRNNISLSTEIFEGVTLEETLPSDHEFFDEVQLNFDKGKLYEAIESLPKDYAEIVRYRLQELTFKEIGKLLNSSHQNIQSKYNTALNMLRYKLRFLRRR